MKQLILFVGLSGLVCGCAPDAAEQPEFGDLHPVTGTVHAGDTLVRGGAVRFDPDPPQPEFLINCEVNPDGSFELTTVRTTDKSGERKPGAPPGTYRVTYMPNLGDQTSGYTEPVQLPKPVTVKAGENSFKLQLPRMK